MTKGISDLSGVKAGDKVFVVWQRRRGQSDENVGSEEVVRVGSDFLPHDPAMMIQIFSAYGQTSNSVHRLVAGSARAFFGFR